uniref:Uncharacterized protein n=1 Tax=Lepeophtheirus salmonis TaxID=72036 RepID=A0A0K2U6B3_LEPSM
MYCTDCWIKQTDLYATNHSL